MSKNDESYFPKEVSSTIADYVESGIVNTNDNGSISGGSFNGSGIGTIKVDASICEKIIIASCKAMKQMTAGGDLLLSTQLALGVDEMMKASTIIINVNGIMTPPPPLSPTPMSGISRGKFSSEKSLMQSSIMSTFLAMSRMIKDGDKFMATQIATAITTYLKQGSISSQGSENLSGSNGLGSLI